MDLEGQEVEVELEDQEESVDLVGLEDLEV